jgi:hypothetical protein
MGEAMVRQFVLIAIITLAFLSGCAGTCENKKACDHFEQVIQKNMVEMAKTENAGIPTADASFFANDTGGCLPGSSTQCPYALEAQYLSQPWPPKLGLSLSGGGTRAASFSIGVMKALKEYNTLDKVDLISSVSGGSYANYWFFSQLFYQYQLNKLGKNKLPAEADIFKTWNDTGTNLDDPDNYRFQRTLEESSEILGYAHKPSFTKDIRVGMQYGVETLFQGLSIPFHWIANGLFDWEVNMTPYYYFYKDGLDRTYGYVPLDYTLDHFANATPGFFGLAENIDAEPILLKEMKAFLEEKKRLPYFVINTTARFGRVYERDGRGQDRLMENNVMEFTPWGCHSELLHFHPSSTAKYSCPLQDFHVEFNRSMGTMELDLARIVAISGAAVDGQTQFVDIAGREEKAYQLFGKTWLEMALETLNLNLGYTSQNQDTSIWLRRFHKLLPWPLYIAHDYLLSLGDNDTATSVHLSDGGHSENLGILPLIRRGTECIVGVDSEYDPESIFESAKRLNQTLARHGYKFKALRRNENSAKPKPTNVHDLKQDLSDAVTEWEIVKQKGDESLDKPIKIIHIKLSAPSKYENSSKLPYTVTSYLKENPDFPHESTADVAYSSDQFRAYRDLGYTIAKEYFSSPKGCVSQ